MTTASHGGRLASISICSGSSMFRIESDRSQQPSRTHISCTSRLPTRLMSGSRIDGERRLLPRLQLELRHPDHGSLGRQVVREWARADRWCAPHPRSRTSSGPRIRSARGHRTRGQQFVEFAKGSQELRMVVARLAISDVASEIARTSDGDHRYLAVAESPAWQACFGWKAVLESMTRNATRLPYALAASSVSFHTGFRSSLPGLVLDVPPVAPDVKHVHEGKRSHAARRGLPASACRHGRPVKVHPPPRYNRRAPGRNFGPAWPTASWWPGFANPHPARRGMAPG